MELAKRIIDAEPKVIVSASCGIEPGKVIQYKPFIDEAQEKAARDDERSFLLQSPSGEKLAGNLKGWPSGLAVDGRVHNVWIEDSLIPGQPPNDDELWPMVGVKLDDGSRLMLAQRVDEAEDLLEFILGTMAVILTVSIGLALTMGWLHI